MFGRRKSLFNRGDEPESSDKDALADTLKSLQELIKDVDPEEVDADVGAPQAAAAGEGTENAASAAQSTAPTTSTRTASEGDEWDVITPPGGIAQRSLFEAQENAPAANLELDEDGIPLLSDVVMSNAGPSAAATSSTARIDPEPEAEFPPKPEAAPKISPAAAQLSIGAAIAEHLESVRETEETGATAAGDGGETVPETAPAPAPVTTETASIAFDRGSIPLVADEIIDILDRRLRDTTGQPLDTETRSTLRTSLFTALQDWAAATETRLRDTSKH